MRSTLTIERPHLADRATRTMAVVHTVGEPSHVAGPALAALYSAVEALRVELRTKGRDFEIEPLRARWPDAHLVPKTDWHGAWALRVPDDTIEVARVVRGVEVEVERWDYGPVAEILHVGPFTTEPESVARLHEFIEAEGLEIAGAHEEEYLTPPGGDDQRTIIRYPVRKRGETR